MTNEYLYIYYNKFFYKMLNSEKIITLENLFLPKTKPYIVATSSFPKFEMTDQKYIKVSANELIKFCQKYNYNMSWSSYEYCDHDICFSFNEKGDTEFFLFALKSIKYKSILYL